MTPKLIIPTHPAIDIAALQAVADSIAPGLATLSLTTESETIREPDTRPAYAGKSKLAIKTPCPTCQATGEVKDREGYQAACADCHLGYRHEDPCMDVQHVHVDIGHKTKISIGHLSHPPGVHKGRRDLFVARSHDELAELVKRAVGQAAFEVAKAEGGEAGLVHDRAMALLDAAHASGAFPTELIEQHRAQRITAHARGVVPALATRHPNRPEREVFFLRECAACGRSVSSSQIEQLADHLPMIHTCGAATVTKRVTRVHSLNEAGVHVQTDTAEVLADAEAAP